MRIVTLAAAVMVALTASGLAALTSHRGVAQYPAVPSRGHVALGPVQVLAAAPDEFGTTLAEAARRRYGRIDALTSVRTAPLPIGEAAIVTATAVRWN